MTDDQGRLAPEGDPLLTTEGVITQIPEKNRDAAMPGGGLGAGMY